MYGGAISLYLGGYAWNSYDGIGSGSSSSSTSGSTTTSGVLVSISDVNSSDCSATTTGSQGANSYGGSMSVYIGAYAWSTSSGSSGSSSSTSGSTTASGVLVSISDVNSSDCSATVTGFNGVYFNGANSYGGSMSVYIGAYAWSTSGSSLSSGSSTSGSTTASGVLVSISDVNSSDCSATTTGSRGANSYGGSMSVYIGAYAWSLTEESPFSSCGTTDVSGLVVSISSSRLANSSAVSGTFSQCPLVSISLTCLLLAGSLVGPSSANVSALRSAPAASYCRCVCNAL